MSHLASVRRGILVAIATTAACGASLVHAGAFTQGNLVVQTMGDGVTALSGSATQVSLYEFLPNTPAQAAPVQTLLFPSITPQPGGSPFDLTDSGSATSNGFLSLTRDGTALVSPGYNATLGTASVASSVSTTIGRTIGVTVNSGSIDTSRSLNMLTGNNFRSVASVNGQSFYASGAIGIVYVDNANATTTVFPAGTSSANARVVNISNNGGNQLYVSTASTTFNGTGSNLGIYHIGTSLPTITGSTATNLINTGTGSSPYDFAFNPAFNVAYIADDRATASSGGIQKWTSADGGLTWNLAYVLGTGAGSTVGARGLAVDFSGANPVIFATTAEATADRLIRIDDAGSVAASTVTTLATAPTNFIFRGVDFAPSPTGTVPEPASLSIAALAGIGLLTRRSRQH